MPNLDIASYANILWARHAIFLVACQPTERLEEVSLVSVLLIYCDYVASYVLNLYATMSNVNVAPLNEQVLYHTPTSPLRPPLYKGNFPPPPKWSLWSRLGCTFCQCVTIVMRGFGIRAFIAQNAYCSREIYLQFAMYLRSVILPSIIQIQTPGGESHWLK